MTRSALNTIKKYSYGRQRCFNTNYVKRKQQLRKFDLVMLLDVVERAKEDPVLDNTRLVITQGLE